MESAGDAEIFFTWPPKVPTNAVINSLSNNITMMKIKDLGLTHAHCDSGGEVPRLQHNGHVRINMSHLNDELSNRNGCNLFMSIMNNLTYPNGIRQIPSFEKNRFKAFSTEIFAMVVNPKLGANDAVDEINKMGINPFEYERLMFPIHYENHCSLYVVSNSASIEDSYITTGKTRRGGDKFTGGIHFDSFPTGHDTQMISHSIGGLLDLLWKCWYGEIHPSVSFQRIHVVKPRVPQQSNSNLSCNYVCLFALGIFKTRNKDHTVLHFQSDMKENVTENANFKFNENDVNEFKKQLSVTVMALHSLPNVSNASAKKIQCQTPPNHRTVTQSTKEKNNEFHSALKSPVSSVSHTIGTKVTNGTGNKAVEREANRKYKANERRHKFILNVVIAKLKADGNQNVLLPRQLQKFIKVWIGDHKGSFVEVRQLTQTAMLPHPNDKSRKIFGIIVLHHDERWGLDIIEYERVQCHRSVYFESFVAVQQTDWMKFQKNSLPVAVVRCGVETKLVTQSSISNVTPAQGRTKKAPDRLSSDDSGKLTWEDNKGSLKSAGSTCSEVHFNKVYYGSFVGSDGVLCASNRKVQQNLRSGEIDNALREAIKSRGRGMDSRGNPVGDSRDDKSYDELSKDPLAIKRMQASLLFEMVKGIRNLSLVSHADSPPRTANPRRVLPVKRNSSNPSRPLPTRKKSSKCNRNTTKELPNNKKRPSSPLKVQSPTAKEWPNNKKRLSSPLKVPSSTTKELPSPLKMPSYPVSQLNVNVKRKPPKQAGWTCKHDGCTRQALLKYYHFCGLHRKIVLCSKCKKSQSKCKGGLCRGCFNKSYSEEEIREMKMCVECKVRVSRKMGGRCTVCISLCRQKSYNKKK